MQSSYLHGYDGLECVRLHNQARTLEDLLHVDTRYTDGASVLEAGCGVGAQTLALARNSSGARITCVDLSDASLVEAKSRVEAAGLDTLRFVQADLLDLPFTQGEFDHVFICFVLEHLRDPVAALAEARRVLRPGGTLTVIEGDHGSLLLYPDAPAAHAVVRCQVELQRAAGGDPLIGRRLYPLLRDAGFDAVRVSPRLVYADATRPDLVDGFIEKTFTAMVEGIRGAALLSGLARPDLFDAGIAALRRTTQSDGVFAYTFFKALACKS